MAHLTVQALRQRVEAAIVSVGTFNRSALVWDSFGRDPSSFGHRSFAVGVPAGIWTERGRQKPSVGALVNTTISVRFARKMRIKDQRASYDDALADEHTLIKTVVGISRADITGLVYVDTLRRDVITDGEWYLGEMTFSAQHMLALE